MIKKTIRLFFFIAFVVLLGNCKQSEPTPQPVKYYPYNQPASVQASQDSVSNSAGNPNGINLPRPLISGGAEIIVNSDTFETNNFPYEGYGYIASAPSEPGRFSAIMYLNSEYNKNTSTKVMITIYLSTIVSPMIGTHSLGWYYDNPWYHSTYRNDFDFTLYNINGQTPDYCFLCTDSYLPSAPTSYSVVISSSQIVNGIRVISGSFVTQECHGSRNHSSGFWNVKGTFTNIPLYNQ